MSDLPGTSPPGLRVLLAEDEFLVRMTIAEALADDGFEVMEASTGAAALDLLRQHTDIVALLTDVQLQGPMDGFALAQAAWADRPGLAVVYMSGRPDTRPGAQDPARERYVNKPFLPSQIVAAVREMITQG